MVVLCQNKQKRKTRIEYFLLCVCSALGESKNESVSHFHFKHCSRSHGMIACLSHLRFWYCV